MEETSIKILLSNTLAMVYFNMSTGQNAPTNARPRIQSVNKNPWIKSNPSYAIKIVSASGNVVKTTTSSQPNWQDDMTTLVPGTYIVQVLNNADHSVVGKTTFVKL